MKSPAQVIARLLEIADHLSSRVIRYTSNYQYLRAVGCTPVEYTVFVVYQTKKKKNTNIRVLKFCNVIVKMYLKNKYRRTKFVSCFARFVIIVPISSSYVNSKRSIRFFFFVAFQIIQLINRENSEVL